MAWWCDGDDISRQLGRRLPSLIDRPVLDKAINQRGQADLRTITVSDHQLVAGMDLGDLFGGDADIGALVVRRHGFTTAEQGVAAQGYIIEQELGNLLDFEVPFATLLTQVEVDAKDPAFQNPTKPIGPVYSKAEAEKLAAEKGWAIAPDGDKYRRVVASPRPKRIFEIRPIKWLLEKRAIVICAGGGGIPTMYGDDGKLRGIEAVIDKDLCSSLLASQLDADLLVIATDVNAAFIDFGKPTQKAIGQAHPDDMEKLGFAAGSMGPKVQAACEFARQTGKTAVIGSLSDIEAIVQGTAGTRISTAKPGITYL